MIERLIGGVVGAVVPTRSNLGTLAWAAAESALAIWFLDRASKGKTFVLTPFHQRATAALYLAHAMLSLYQLRKNQAPVGGGAPNTPPGPSSATLVGYGGYGASEPNPWGWAPQPGAHGPNPYQRY